MPQGARRAGAPAKRLRCRCARPDAAWAMNRIFMLLMRCGLQRSLRHMRAPDGIVLLAASRARGLRHSIANVIQATCVDGTVALDIGLAKSGSRGLRDRRLEAAPVARSSGGRLAHLARSSTLSGARSTDTTELQSA
jgi:hypothetical protein